LPNFRELIGCRRLAFQSHVWVFIALTILLGLLLGIGTAAVFKHIPDYFPNEVGVIGGLVGVIGGLGGFVCPIIFGYLLDLTGVWTSCWVFLGFVTIGCMMWMNIVIQRMQKADNPEVA